MANKYSLQRKRDNEKKIRQIQDELPPVVGDFMRSILEKSDLTRLGYIRDLRTFFYFLPRTLPRFSGVKPSEITVEQLESIKLRDLDLYKEYLTMYKKPQYGGEEMDIDEDDKNKKDTTNENCGLARKFCALRAFYSYMYINELISENITEKLKVPSAPNKEIIYLDKQEISKVLDVVQTGTGMSERQKKYQEGMRVRDIAILYLLLGTGIRASECVGLDIEHFDFEKNQFIVTRKGAKEMKLYFNDDVKKALQDYLSVRTQIETDEENKHAMFLSTQKRRITTRALQNLVTKYASVAVPGKQHLSPHKMRSSFGTALYDKTKDINIVANTLGHSNVNTTKKHYVHEKEEGRREAAKMVDWT